MMEEKRSNEMKLAIKALQMAYRKHHCGDDSIGWDELGNALYDALCELMGDAAFVEWNESFPE